MNGQQARDVIEARVAKFVDTFNRGDAAGLATLYTHDGMILPPNMEPMSGREAIQGFWQAGMDAGLASAKLEVVEVGVGPDAIYEVGKFGLFTQNGAEADAGKYIVIWKQEDGDWCLFRDIWNSSRPAPA